MTHRLRFNYDDRDFLELWLPESEKHPVMKRDPGLYKAGSCAKNPGAKRAFDSIMIDSFSKAYSHFLDEVLTKEPPIDHESYDVPELDLYGVPLSRILEEIHNRYVITSEGISTAEKVFS